MEPIPTENKPKKTKAVRSSVEVLEAIQAAGMDKRRIYAAIRGAEIDVAELESQAFTHATAFGVYAADHPVMQNRPFTGGFLSILEPLKNLAACRAFLDIAANSEQGKIAVSILRPLFDELEQANEREKIEIEAANAANRELESAKESARAEMESKLDQHPLVIEAAKKVAPFYRKGELVAP